MSCRVLQRGVEIYTMNKIFEYAKENGYSKIIGKYKPTSKNKMVADFYKSFGFALVEGVTIAREGEETWSLSTSKYIPKKTFVNES